MYKILYIPSGEILDLPETVNKEESDKLITLLLRYNKVLARSNKYTFVMYREVLEKFQDLHISELESIFVSAKQSRFQIMHIPSNLYFDEFFETKEKASIKLNEALKKQHLYSSDLRKWIVTIFSPKENPIYLAFDKIKPIFDNPKVSYLSRIKEFNIVEV